MNEAIKTMLKKYHCQSFDDYENALKEIMQEIILLGLWRAKFFENAAFYGGSALRIIHGLDRFSEDLDFSLIRKSTTFSFTERYLPMIENELKSFGFTVDTEKKEKESDSNIESAFIKGGTFQNFISMEIPPEITGRIHAKKRLKIKIEIDIDPPLNFETEAKTLVLPIPFSVVTYTLPDLFAGKLHAVLCRSWKTRVKGRDWYDMAWYVARSIPCHITHLEARMRQSGHYLNLEKLSEEKIKQLLKKKINSLKIDNAKNDVKNFLKDPGAIEIWAQKYFHEIVDMMQFY